MGSSGAAGPAPRRVTDLDDVEAVAGLDSQDVLGTVERFDAQCREGWTLGLSTPELPDASGVDSIVVLGMGGSGISGEVVQAIVEPRLPVPFVTIKGYGPLPEWIGRNSLVFAVSYSGDTEETLEAVEVARSRGARIVAVCSGGRLADRALTWGTAHISIPPGGQPRASLGWLAMSILGALSAVGLVPDLSQEAGEAVEVLGAIAERCNRAVPAEDNEAKELARRLVGKVPVIYGAHGVGAVAAQRFKTDLNEYAKTPAFYNYLPELDHNEIAGYAGLSDLTSSAFHGVMLRDSGEHDRVSLRFDVTRKLIEPSLAGVAEVRSEGRSSVARLLSLVLITQLAAIYLGVAYGNDPGPVEVIDELKAELKAG